jgi:hypothetical protein
VRGSECKSSTLTGPVGRRTGYEETMMGWVGAAPTGTGTRGEVAGDVSSAEVLGRLGERTSTERTPGVRR